MEEEIISGEEALYDIGKPELIELPTYEDYYDGLIKKVFRKWRRFPPQLDQVDNNIKVPAIVNYGRWVVKCPWCAGAERLYLTKLQFVCLSCLNKAVNGNFIAVDLPSFHKAIEVQLLKRPIEFRNYDPGQTVADLVAENNEHGWR